MKLVQSFIFKNLMTHVNKYIFKKRQVRLTNCTVFQCDLVIDDLLAFSHLSSYFASEIRMHNNPSECENLRPVNVQNSTSFQADKEYKINFTDIFSQIRTALKQIKIVSKIPS